MVTRLTITLEQSEYSGLLRMAVENLRTPEDQLRWLLLREVENQQPSTIQPKLGKKDDAK